MSVSRLSKPASRNVRLEYTGLIDLLAQRQRSQPPRPLSAVVAAAAAQLHLLGRPT